LSHNPRANQPDEVKQHRSKGMLLHLLLELFQFTTIGVLQNPPKEQLQQNINNVFFDAG
jgi:hypothetical protein